MIAHHIHDALTQVRRLQDLILEKRLFRGYSGIARMAGGIGALIGATVLSSPQIPATPSAHLLGWAGIMLCALALNYGGLLLWFRSSGRPTIRELIPVLDAIPALAVGGGLSVALILHDQYDLLFGTWMCLYGLVHMPYRNSLPRGNYLVGLFYLVCGAITLVMPGISFTDPRPMGVVFGAGELAGGYVLYRLNRETRRELEETSSHEIES